MNVFEFFLKTKSIKFFFFNVDVIVLKQQLGLFLPSGLPRLGEVYHLSGLDCCVGNDF